MRKFGILLIVFVIMLCGFTPAFAANVLQNADFENGAGSTPSNWTTYDDGSGNAVSEWGQNPGGVFPPPDLPFSAYSGTHALKLAVWGVGGFAAAYQDYFTFNIGDNVVFSARARSTAPSPTWARLKIEFRDGGGAISTVASTDINNDNALGSYSNFTIGATVPAGTTHIRFILEINRNGGSGGDIVFDSCYADIGPGAVSPTSDKDIRNWSFEEGSGTSANDWGAFNETGGSYARRLASGSTIYPPFEGSWAMQMHVENGNFVGIYQFSPDIFPGTHITFSGYARADDMHSGNTARLKIEYAKWDEDGNEILLKSYESEAIDNTNAGGDYVKFSAAGKAPGGTQFVKLVVVADSYGGAPPGTIMFDAMSAVINYGPYPPVEVSGRIYSTENFENAQKIYVALYDESGALIASGSENPYKFYVSPLVNYYYRIEAEGYTFPSSAPLSFSPAPGAYGEIFQMARFGGTVDIPVDPGYPIILTKDVNKKQAVTGDILVYSLTLENRSGFATDNLLLRDELPEGFHFLEGSAVLNGKPIADPTFNSPMTFTIGSIPGNGKYVLSYRAAIGTKVSPGQEFTTTAYAWSSARDWQLSNESSATVKITFDPIFDLGTIIGKVFNDVNANGVQDKGEIGLAGVRLVTEYGVMVYTDSNGKYHIPAIRPGRHVVKVDAATLPRGSTLVTEEAYIVKVTEGLLAKVNFAVQVPLGVLPDSPLDKTMQVNVMPNTDSIQPKLSIALPSEDLVMDQITEKGILFTSSCNFRNLIALWTVHIKDFSGKTVAKIERSGALPETIPWNGLGREDAPLRVGQVYSYQLTVLDNMNNEARTAPAWFTVRSQEKMETPFLVEEEAILSSNYSAVHKIPLDSMQSVKVSGKVAMEDIDNVAVDETPLAVSDTGSFEEELYLEPGLHVLKVRATDEEGKTITTTREVDVKDNYFIMVGFAEGELGHNTVSDKLQDVLDDDEFKDGYYQKGRLAYFLKGKIKGKYILTSSLDTDRKKGIKYFTDIDPDRYYPVYGDKSDIDYAAEDANGRFFIMIEADNSFFRWGSYEAEYANTKLATYQRTLSGGKLHLERNIITEYGDPVSAFSGFYADAETSGAHDEFSGTGGSLYYLKHDEVVEGSDKVKVIVRDKITGIIQGSWDLSEGTDYEIDYYSGRVILRKPLSAVAYSTTIISNSIMEGNQPVLVVDYEYRSEEKFNHDTMGARGYTHVLENVRIGGTYVEEQNDGESYKLTGADVLVKLWENTQIQAEFAESQKAPTSASFSQDGGITFTDAAFSRDDRQEAYGIWAQTGLWNWGAVQAYYQKIEPGFVNMNLIDQEGTVKWGGEISARLGSQTKLYIKHDTQEMESEISEIATDTVGARELHTTTAQLVHLIKKWTIVGEYRHQEADEPIDEFMEDNQDTAAVQVAYQLSPRLIPFIEQQFSITGEDNNQTRFGAKLRVWDSTDVLFRETIGDRGDATQLEISSWIDGKNQVYWTQTYEDDVYEGKSWKSVNGLKSKVNDKSSFYTEREYAGMERGTKEGTVIGYDTEIWKNLHGALGYERSNLDYKDELLERDAVSGRLSYNLKDVFRVASKVEFRQDKGDEEERQWLTTNVVEYTINEAIDFLGRFNFSETKNQDTGELDARFYEVGCGVAFRPLDWDWLNFLVKYSYIYDLPMREQAAGGPWILEKAHLFSVEGIYDINKYFQLVEKVAIKTGEVTVDHASTSELQTVLWINRLNFHLTRKWDIGIEYRILDEKQTDDRREGFLLEVDREIGKYFRLGVGYNFTNFSDDLRNSDDDVEGFFIRATGKF